MRDTIPTEMWKNYCGIVNLDSSVGPGNIGPLLKNIITTSFTSAVLEIYAYQKSY